MMVLAYVVAALHLVNAVPSSESVKAPGVAAPGKTRPKASKSGKRAKKDSRRAGDKKPSSAPVPGRTAPTLSAEERMMMENKDFLLMLELLMDLPIVADESDLEGAEKDR